VHIVENETIKNRKGDKMSSKKAPKIEVPGLKIERFTMTIVGDSPLISHRFSEKAKKMMLDKMMKKASPGREPKDPEAEFESSLYKIPGENGMYGFPAMGFKNGAVRAAKSIPDMAMTDARGWFHVICEDHMLLPLRYQELRMGEDAVRPSRGGADLRYRGYFYGWETDITVEYNSATISPEQIALLFDIAGFSVGVGDHRPEKNGPYGRYHVKKGSE
jgi:hypothetical protein